MNVKKTILIGALIRFSLMPFIAHPFDTYAWYTYCNSALSGNFSFLVSVAPLWMLTLTAMAYVYGYLSAITGMKAIPVAVLPPQMDPQWGILYIPGPLFNVIVKIPMVLSDIATTFLLYKMVSDRYGVAGGENVALFFFLNPAVIWISSAWGQYDSIPTMFTVISLYLLLNGRLVYSALSLLTATLYKVYPMGFLIPVAIYLFKKEPHKSSLKYLSVFLIPVFLSIVLGLNTIAFIVDNFSPWTFYGIFGFGLTYWSISMIYPLNVEIFNSVSIGLMLLLTTFSAYRTYKAEPKDDLLSLTFSTILVAASVFLSYRYPTEQRIVWIMPFLAIATSTKYVSEKLFWPLSLMSFLYMQKTFPQYLLPVVAISRDALIPLFQSTEQFRVVAQGTLAPSLTGAIVLSALGISFSIFLLAIYLKMLKIIKTDLARWWMDGRASNLVRLARIQ